MSLLLPLPKERCYEIMRYFLLKKKPEQLETSIFVKFLCLQMRHMRMKLNLGCNKLTYDSDVA
jgi:hypothetical protein